jgi:hypothetical protein
MGVVRRGVVVRLIVVGFGGSGVLIRGVSLVTGVVFMPAVAVSGLGVRRRLMGRGGMRIVVVVVGGRLGRGGVIVMRRRRISVAMVVVRRGRFGVRRFLVVRLGRRRVGVVTVPMIIGMAVPVIATVRGVVAGIVTRIVGVVVVRLVLVAHLRLIPQPPTRSFSGQSGIT